MIDSMHTVAAGDMFGEGKVWDRWSFRLWHTLVAAGMLALVLITGTRPVWPTETEPISDASFAVELLSQSGGLTTGLAVRNQLLFVGMGRRLLVVDISNLYAPQVVGRSELLPAPVETVRLGDNYAVVQLPGHYEARDRGLRVLDLTDVSRPHTVGMFEDTAGGPRLNDLKVENNYAFGYYNSQLDVIDLWDREHPRYYGRYRNDDELYLTLAVSGGLAFLGSSDGGNRTPGLRIVDVSNRARPTGMAFLPLGQEIRKIVVHEQYAYLYGYGSGVDSILYVIDIGDPAQPRVVGRAAISNDYIVSSWSEMVMHRNHILLFAGAGMGVIDVRDPALPRVVRQFDWELGGRYAAVAGDWAFVADGNFNQPLKVIDIEDPSLPTLRLTYSVADVGHARRIEGFGSRVYTLNSLWRYPLGWLRIFDAAEPRSPRMLGELALPAHLRNVVVTDQGHVFVLSDQGLLAIDAVDPASPRIAGAVATYGTLTDVAVRLPYGYVADGPAGLTVLDLADPERMDVVASIRLPFDAENVVVVGEHAFVVSAHRCPDSRTCGNERLVSSVDIENPRRPKLVGQMAIASIPQSNLDQVLVSANGYIYVIDRQFQILDIENPNRMSVISNTWWGTDTGPESATIDGQFMFTSGDAGLDWPPCCLSVIDISDPLEPYAEYRAGTYGSALDVWPHDGQLAIADGRQGLTIFRLTTPTPPGGPTATPTPPITPPPDATATPTLGIRVLPATPEFTPYPFPTPRPATPTPSLRQQIFMPLAQRAATG
jgi:hypothetical protein